MKKLLTATAICAAVLLVALPVVQAQVTAPPPAQAPDKIFQGQLTKVDANAKSISVKGADAEMLFEYSDSTQVVGSPNVQGLAGKTGTELKVSYRDAGGKHMATKIETIEKK